ncbi:DcaP family trimeric outer membrane transporter [Acinetobacter dispersus]|uniref:DcaP-like protein n=1 Tax=Acinetobacter dispersus TaxID=70348 RepID=N9LG31_9GAMM|nr:DcaP family trimeric outer membrane transporter [Acinetobacter dispersus]ENW95188.1 hypothetical protein F904_00479 [Acinetobacter dispersus]
MKNALQSMKKMTFTAMVLTVMSPVYAQTKSSEIESLRNEVEDLKATLQNYVQDGQIKTSEVVTKIEAPSKSAPKLNILKSGTDVSLYGMVRADATYQAAGADGMFNNINSVPLENTPEAAKQQDRFKSSPSVTRIGLDFKTPTTKGDIGGKIEMDFVGGATRDQFRIRHAYLTYDKWVIGQAWSTFVSPIEFMPETVDPLGHVGGALMRTPLVRYSDVLSTNTSYAVSIEDQKYLAHTDPDHKIRLPALVGRINHQYADGAGLVSARTFMAEKKISTDKNMAWGVGLGTKYQITPKTVFKGDYYHVKGDGRYVLWSNNGYAIDDNKKMHSNEFDAVTVGLTHQFTPQFRSTLGYGYMLAKDDNAFARLNHNNPTQNKKAWQGWISAMYSPYKSLTFGAEYVYGERKTFDERTGEDNRVNIMASFNF